MSKQLFAIILDPTTANLDSTVDDLVRKQYPDKDHRRHSEYLYLVLEDEGVLTAEVAKKVGLDSDSGKSNAVATGVVLKLDYGYAGLAEPSTWEWLRNAWNSAEG